MIFFRVAPTTSVQHLIILRLILDELYAISLVARVHSYQRLHGDIEYMDQEFSSDFIESGSYKTCTKFDNIGTNIKGVIINFVSC